MAYLFRVLLSISDELDTDGPELELWSEGGERVWLESQAASLRDAKRMTLRGGPFETAVEATARAEHWLATLTLAFLRRSIAADFLTRRSFSSLSDDARALMQSKLDNGWVLINDHPGIHVYAEDQKPIAIHMEAAGKVVRSAPELVSAFHDAGRVVTPNVPASLAYDLYSASFAMPSADATLLTLVNAIEVMINQRRLDNDAVELVQRLVRDVESSELPEKERTSLGSRVNALKKESIRQAGLRLARSLGNGQYNGTSAEDFFDYCYKLRSELTHGDRPTLDAVQDVISELGRFVRELIDLAFQSRSPGGEGQASVTRPDGE